jgi:hypothetical protein
VKLSDWTASSYGFKRAGEFVRDGLRELGETDNPTVVVIETRSNDGLTFLIFGVGDTSLVRAKGWTDPDYQRDVTASITLTPWSQVNAVSLAIDRSTDDPVPVVKLSVAGEVVEPDMHGPLEPVISFYRELGTKLG